MPFLEFAVAVARWQDERGRLFVIENPAASRAWKQDVMQDLVNDYGVVTFDMCTQDLTDPYRGVPLKKRTGVLTNSDALRAHLKELRCTCTEKHGIVAGSTWQQVDGVWRATSLATFAGGYTAQFAKTLLTKTCEDLVAWTCPVMTFADQRR